MLLVEINRLFHGAFNSPIIKKSGNIIFKRVNIQSSEALLPRLHQLSQFLSRDTIYMAYITKIGIFMEILLYLISDNICVSCGLACNTVYSVYEMAILRQRAPCLLPSPHYYASQTPVEQLTGHPCQLII